MREFVCHGFVVAAVAALGACTSTVPSEPFGLIITEIAAAGIPDDWVEVKNISDEPVDLDNFTIVDDRKDVDRARPVGAVTLAPGERYVRVVNDSTVGFRLGANEELWMLRVSDGALMDGLDWRRGDSPRGGSLSRRGDTGPFETVLEDTRDRANPE